MGTSILRIREHWSERKGNNESAWKTTKCGTLGAWTIEGRGRETGGNFPPEGGKLEDREVALWLHLKGRFRSPRVTRTPKAASERWGSAVLVGLASSRQLPKK